MGEKKRVGFVIVGAMKCGTTSLAKWLTQHPEVCFSRIKEPNLFTQDDWRARIEDYHSLFQGDARQIWGEGSVTYTCFPEYGNRTAENMFEYNPECRIIYLIRDPMERIRSHYSHYFLKGRIKEPIDKAVLRYASYVNRSRYFMQIEPYLEHFGRKNVLVLRLEEMMRDPLKLLEEVAGFLGIDGEWFREGADLRVRNGSVDRSWETDRCRAVQEWALVRRAPLPVRKLLRRLLSKRIGEKAELSPDTREALWRLLKQDLEEIEKVASVHLCSGSPDVRVGT